MKTAALIGGLGGIMAAVITILGFNALVGADQAPKQHKTNNLVMVKDAVVPN